MSAGDASETEAQKSDAIGESSREYRGPSRAAVAGDYPPRHRCSSVMLKSADLDPFSPVPNQLQGLEKRGVSGLICGHEIDALSLQMECIISAGDLNMLNPLAMAPDQKLRNFVLNMTLNRAT